MIRNLILAAFMLVIGVLALSQQPSPTPLPPSHQVPNAYVRREKAVQCWRKFQYLKSNGAAQEPDPNPTVLHEDEVNAYIAEGKVELPNGVQSVRFEAAPNVITAHARVDFDRITAGSRSTNPLLSLFTGVHEIVAVADAKGAGGIGAVSIRSVSLDGANIPRVALEYFVDRYIRPKHPEIGMDTRFRMPYRIDSAQVGEHTLTLKQK